MFGDPPVELQKKIAALKDSKALCTNPDHEMIYLPSKSILIFNWVFSDDQLLYSWLRQKLRDFLASHVLKSYAITTDWIDYAHFLPRQKTIASGSNCVQYKTVCVQFTQEKYLDQIWSGRRNLATYNSDKGKNKAFRKVALERQRTKQFLEELRYLDAVRQSLLKRDYNRQQVRVNGRNRERPTITVDLLAYTAFVLPAAIYGEVGAFPFATASNTPQQVRVYAPDRTLNTDNDGGACVTDSIDVIVMQ